MSSIVRPTNAISAHEFGGWTLYELPARPYTSILWPAFKLVTKGRKKWGRHRVFYVNWSALECRFARSRQAQWFLTEQPELHFDVELHLARFYDRAWLEKYYTADEIAAEIARLALPRERRPLAS